MRTAITTLLILALLGGQLGMLGALVGRYHAQHEQKREIAADDAPGNWEEVRHLTLSRAERESQESSFVWIEEGEFRFEGNLYDIVHEEWRGDVWHAWVLHDREEEQYLEALAQSMNPSVVSGTTVPPRPISFRPLALTPTGLDRIPRPRVRSHILLPRVVASHQAPYLEVPHPPPWA